MKRSASLYVDVLQAGKVANASPAFGFHFIEVFHAGQISSGVGTSSLSSFLAYRVGQSEIISTSYLHGLRALDC